MTRFATSLLLLDKGICIYKIRVISARDMSKKERGAYHEQIEENTEV